MRRLTAPKKRDSKRFRKLRLIECLERRELLAAGQNLAVYEFNNHSAATPELFSTDVHPQTTASDITSPLTLGSTGNGNPPNGLALGAEFDEIFEPTPFGGQDDYFEVKITPDPGFEMSTSRFSMQIRRNDPDSKDSYAVYFDEAPDGAGNNFTTKLASGTITSEDVFEKITIDVEGLPEFTDQTEALTFRVYVWGTVGLETMRLDNIRVQAVQQTVSESALAFYGDAGRLLHPLDEQGNRIADFSTAGFRNGNEPIPDVTQLIGAARVVTISPIPGDDMPTVQAAIDQVGALPLDINGFRGIVQLTPGVFDISDQLQILDSGVVLRGAGDGDDPASNTILRGTGTLQRSLVVVGASSGFASGIGNTTHNIIDKYVPVGATSLLVDSTTNWSVGDPVIVRRPSPSEWISDIGMDMIPPRDDGGLVVQWTPGSFDQLYEREITRIEGNRVFFNAPLMNSFEQQYGGGTIFRFTFPRINNVGIENIRGVSDFVGEQDENHATTFIELQAVEDAWVTNVTGQHFVFATVHATSRAIRVTVDDAASLEPVSIITGGRRYPFTIDGQFILMQDLYSEEGRHDFVNNASVRNRGPNVFLNGTAVNSNSSTGPHQRWSSGTLYDTITTDNLTEARNRGNFGSGHGWGGANMVFWNNTATQFIVQNPPTAQNWLIGSSGQIVDDMTFGPQPAGTVSEHETPIDFNDPANPLSSLYVAQHNQRVSPLRLEKREYVLGDFDLVEFDGPASADNVFVDPAWQSQVSTFATNLGQILRPFDNVEGPDNARFVPFSFSYFVDPLESVHAATLSLGLRGLVDDTTDIALRVENINVAIPVPLTGPLAVDETTPILIELTGLDLDDLQDGLFNLSIDGNAVVDWAVLDLTFVDGLDLGDAPSPYPTLIDQEGARHIPTGPRLGDSRDSEPDGQPSTGADGDGDDEDGVTFGTITVGNTRGNVAIDLQNAVEARVDAWLDFNADGVWQESEQILRSVQTIAGPQTLDFPMDPNAVIGDTFARVRVSTVGGLDPTGFSLDGEVEDYLVPILADVFVVNSVANTSDADPGNGICNAGNGVCTLQAAIEESNATPNLAARTDTIQFDIFGGGPFLITPTTALPVITEPVNIDATTQSGYTGSPVVQLDGNDTLDVGFTSDLGGMLVRGFSVTGFTDAAISLAGGGGSTVSDNYLGIDGDGNVGRNRFGVKVVNSVDNVISSNLISGNRDNGVFINGDAATGNTVDGNRIGTDAEGTTRVPNLRHGVALFAPDNVVSNNLISGNNGWGVFTRFATGGGNVINNNWIGVDVTGAAPLANAAGVQIRSPNNEITDNIISGNVQGVIIAGADSAGTTVQGNRIGTDPTGTIDIGNGVFGVGIFDSANNSIGGLSLGDGNLISGNGRDGVIVARSGSTDNSILRNKIGIHANGNFTLANDGDGVRIVQGASDNRVESNTISGNARRGVAIDGATTSGNTIRGNIIGRSDVLTTVPVHNGSGVAVLVTAPNNTIENNIVSAPETAIAVFKNHASGNTISGNDIGSRVELATPDGIHLLNGAAGTSISGNTIANGERAIILTAAGQGNDISENVIFGNSQIGIDLGGDGMTPNDGGDVDEGPNRLQNTPRLTAASVAVNNVQITYLVSSILAASTYPIRVEFFATNDGQARVLLGSDIYTAGDRAIGEKTILLTDVVTLLAAGDFVTATATDAEGNTSELSFGVLIAGIPA